MSAILLIIAYLLGSIPSGILLAQAFGEGDLRKIGSGNIGATNALRTGNKKLAVATLLADLLKGTLAVLIVGSITGEMEMLAALVAVIGHCFPIWLKFKGGKGVATGLGTMLAVSPILFILMVVTWLIGFKVTRVSSVGALAAFALAPFYAFALGFPATDIGLLGLLSLLIYWTHRDNIRRLLNGEELLFKNKNKNKTEDDAHE